MCFGCQVSSVMKNVIQTNRQTAFHIQIDRAIIYPETFGGLGKIRS